MRGDVYRLRPKAGTGHEQRRVRYGVVVQSISLPMSTVLWAPTSTSHQPATFRPEIELDDIKTRVLVEQLRAVDTTRLGDFAGRLEAHELQAIDQALRDVLDLL